MTVPNCNWNMNLDIKDTQCAKTQGRRKMSHHIVLRLGATGVQKRCFRRQNIHFSSKVTKFAERIRIDLRLIFWYDSFCAIISYSDIIDFVYFFTGLNRNVKKKKQTHFYSGGYTPRPLLLRHPSRSR